MSVATQNIYLNVPQSEVGFITSLSQKMGWTISTAPKPRPKLTVREKQMARFRKAVRQTEKMAADIRKNGIAGYQTMDEFLATL